MGCTLFTVGGRLVCFGFCVDCLFVLGGCGCFCGCFCFCDCGCDCDCGCRILRFPEGIDDSGGLTGVDDGKVDEVEVPVTFLTAGDSAGGAFDFRGGALPLEVMFLFGMAISDNSILSSLQVLVGAVGKDSGKAGSNDSSTGDSDVCSLPSIT